MISEDLIQAAFNRLFDTQLRLKCRPDCRVIVNGIVVMPGELETTNELRCTLDPELLGKVLRRDEHWNNLELGCHVTFERKGPYFPDVHTLLCFWHA